eukprot:1279678-Amphidinium_carterae.2
MTACATTSHSEKVRHVAVDDTSPLLFESLKEVLPNLEYLSLDPLHLVFRVRAVALEEANTGQSLFAFGAPSNPASSMWGWNLRIAVCSIPTSIPASSSYSNT